MAEAAASAIVAVSGLNFPRPIAQCGMIAGVARVRDRPCMDKIWHMSKKTGPVSKRYSEVRVLAHGW